MKIQVLISTMNRKDLSFLDSMNLETDAVIGNQNGQNSIEHVERECGNLLIVCSNQKGLSNNRNVTLKYSTGDICIIADDDVEYVDNYAELIKEKFNKFKEADVIVFNVLENPIKRFVIRNEHKVRGYECLKYCSVRIAFRRDSIVSNNIQFDPNFGAGSKVPMGEDNIFLLDCAKKNLTIMACPEYLVKIREERASTWFKGYNDTLLSNKGKVFKRLFPRAWFIMCVQDVVRHNKLYRNNGNVLHNLSVMIHR